MKRLARYGIDGFIIAILIAAVIGVLAPATGVGAEIITWLTRIGIAVLFFLYGTRITPQDALRGLAHWRLHLTILTITFILFPVIGLLIGQLPGRLLAPELYAGILFLTLLPSTVQASIAFTSIARGNVAAAIVSASASNLLGVLITPLLVIMLMNSTGHAQVGSGAILAICVQLLLPFMLGQLARRWLAVFLAEHPRTTRLADRGAIVLVVYAAFSESAREHVWDRVTAADIAVIVGFSIVLLAVVLGLSHGIGRVLGFDNADRSVILFAGSKKSLASGLPMAAVMFSGPSLGMIVLPVMIFHQIQLIVCAIIANRLGHAYEQREPQANR
ncbi:bile acid:sodium symporter [Hoyosella sp. G463]|uniref:Bile acid:sodium symporter n=1 Tax=Lolliginicoccus lacisalsi TaxID=2742202 RepID=A0A927JDD0_9ACTN|nr:bile acid:sodium symporter family protein [Lolliginicoccus lacisalsi]MBD8507043.1 bile acid:sodium symporter [Lolliginicoccus lacisalsi]